MATRLGEDETAYYADAVALFEEGGGNDRQHDSEQEEDDDAIVYGPVRLNVAPKEGKANTLLADQLFSPSLLLAERIERGLIDLGGKTVLELGAGCALPSLLASTMPAPHTPKLLVITDYPSPSILTTLEKNVSQNAHRVQEGCTVLWQAHEWGTDVQPLLSHLDDPRQGFDVVILSDLLHFDRSHAELAASLVGVLGRHRDARAYVAAGKYTAWGVCEGFLERTLKMGMRWSEEMSESDAEKGRWRGQMGVRGVPWLDTRKGNTWWWVGGRE